MDNETKSRTLVTVLIIGIIIVVLSMILLLWFIWTPNKNTKEVKVKPGQFETVYINRDLIAERYAKQLGDLFLAKAYDSLYDLLSNEYKDAYKMDYEKFKTFIGNKGLMGKDTVCRRYLVQNINGKNYYKLFMETKNGYANLNINLLEESPDVYTISFDEYMFARNLNTEYIKNGFKMTVIREELYSNRLLLDFKLENLTGSDLVINSESQIAVFATKRKGEKEDLSSNLTQQVPRIIKQSETVNVHIDMSINDFSHSSIRGIIVKGVKIGNSKPIDIEFPYQVSK